MTARGPKLADVKIRTIALDAVLRASSSIKGWEMKSGGELLAEAQHVENYLRTGKLPAQPKKPAK